MHFGLSWFVCTHHFGWFIFCLCPHRLMPFSLVLLLIAIPTAMDSLTPSKRMYLAMVVGLRSRLSPTNRRPAMGVAAPDSDSSRHVPQPSHQATQRSTAASPVDMTQSSDDDDASVSGKLRGRVIFVIANFHRLCCLNKGWPTCSRSFHLFVSKILCVAEQWVWGALYRKESR